MKTSQCYEPPQSLSQPYPVSITCQSLRMLKFEPSLLGIAQPTRADTSPQHPLKNDIRQKDPSRWWSGPFFTHSPSPVVPITFPGTPFFMKCDDIGCAFMKAESKTGPASMVATFKSMDFVSSLRALRKFFTAAKRSESLISKRHGSGSRIDHSATSRTPHNPHNKPSDQFKSSNEDCQRLARVFNRQCPQIAGSSER